MDLKPLPDHLPDGTAWYCLRTRNRSEHIAAAGLKQLGNVDTFCPRIRYHKATKRGKVLFQQAMFPSYLFARFDFDAQYRAVTYANAVTGIVRFGESEYPTIAPVYIDFLRSEIGPEEVRYLESTLEPGDEVEIAEGPFRGLRAIVQHYLPAQDRVRVLMEILGGEQTVNVAAADLVNVRER